MYAYPMHLEPEEDGGILVTLPDLPGCHTDGDTREDAIANAVGALRAMIGALVRDREEIPSPSPAHGRPVARLPVLDSLKVRLYQEMRIQGVGQSDLARRLGVVQKDVWRLLDLGYASKVERLEAAFAALDMVVDIHVRPRAIIPRE
jgi:antitoxin HicB